MALTQATAGVLADGAVTTAKIADGAVTAAKTTGLNTVPAGVVSPYAGASAPTGWLLCYGQAVSRTTYADLFTAISTTYGVGDGSTTFNLPDLRGRVAAGKDDMGGAAASRLTTGASGVDGATLGASGGSETHTLVDGELPTTTINNPALTATPAFGDNTPGSVASATDTTFGGDGAHNNTQPTFVFNYIIRT
jgi:microcystin-dependent protein